jgi:hypothetical protein
MANFRGSASSYDIGEKPPTVIWTVVRGDTSGFKVYVVDDAGEALIIADWTINMKIKRPNNNADLGIITDDATLVMELNPEQDADDLVGEFTVWLTSEQSVILETGDIFDIQLSDATRVWTVCQGSMKILEDVTD